MLQYCNGNVAVLRYFSFSDIVSIIDYKRKEQDNKNLLRAYEVTYAALANIPFSVFCEKAKNRYSDLLSKSANEIEADVANYIDNYNWQEVT